MADLLELPFHFLRVPNLKLRIPNISAPSATTVFFLVLASYYLVFSGIIYDVIVEPPSIGSHRDEGGSVKPVVFLQYRINGQYIIEGLAAGLLFVLGGVGIIILNKANQKNASESNRYMFIICGAVCLLLAYNLSIVFLRMKLPGYQQGM